MTARHSSKQQPRLIKTVAALRRALQLYRDKAETIALVPTMGALHAGHMDMVRLAKRKAKRVVVSIFVNPTQFAPNEDFSSYPRTLATDRRALSALGIDAIWVPAVTEMYRPGFSTQIAPRGPAVVSLEDAFRPHFFSGVATVVGKLFVQVGPDFALFGEKDYQQLKVVTRMASDLDLPVKIVGLPTVREPDGLAMSSRNFYLSARERAIAPTLHRVLGQCAGDIAAGQAIDAVLARGREAIVQAGFVLDYLEARHAETLAPLESSGETGPIRLLVAARIGKTRLIDNIGVALRRK